MNVLSLDATITGTANTQGAMAECNTKSWCARKSAWQLTGGGRATMNVLSPRRDDHAHCRRAVRHGRAQHLGCTHVGVATYRWR